MGNQGHPGNRKHDSEKNDPQEEKNEEDRSKFDDLRESSMSVENLEELIDENHAIVSSSVGTDITNQTGHFDILQMVDPTGTANWSVTHVDWSKGKWHPKAYRSQDVTFELLKNISSDESYHVTSDEKKVVSVKPCLWNGMKRPCYLFARKFYPEALHNLMQLFSNYTLI
ncbi:hypothetical protein C4D60_Mb04t12260 [Musa balbisiana]|uniref:Uncharacterized protein n=1 Tax=Musa balbisiana TaxID=52838 RepID=A0A4S8KBF8_MUSBA|nr:hypothetical protein C4D60_Mb04t12260 [Musa balbisiana]